MDENTSESRTSNDDPRPQLSAVTALVQGLREHGPVGLAMFVFLGMVLACVAGPHFVHYSPIDSDFNSIAVPPSITGHLFGTDDLGRDLLARVLVGGRTSLLIATSATGMAVLIGTIYGSVAGYFGGFIDQVMMRVVEILYGLPFLFFVIMLTIVLGRGVRTIFISISALVWLTVAIVVRGQTLGLRNTEFLEAARACGTRPLTIVRRHILPNVMGTVIAYAGLLVPEIIMGESLLSYLGLGVQEPSASWGTLISTGAESIESAPWQLLFPSAALAVTLFSLNFIANGLRDFLDPKLRMG